MHTVRGSQTQSFSLIIKNVREINLSLRPSFDFFFKDFTGLGMELSRQSASPPCMKPCVQSPALCKLNMLVHTSDPAAWELKPARLKDHDHIQLHKKFKARLGHVRPYLRKKKSLHTFHCFKLIGWICKAIKNSCQKVERWCHS